MLWLKISQYSTYKNQLYTEVFNHYFVLNIIREYLLTTNKGRNRLVQNIVPQCQIVCLQ